MVPRPKLLISKRKYMNKSHNPEKFVQGLRPSEIVFVAWKLNMIDELHQDWSYLF
jgi:hypothetical protein